MCAILVMCAKYYLENIAAKPSTEDPKGPLAEASVAASDELSPPRPATAGVAAERDEPAQVAVAMVVSRRRHPVPHAEEEA